MEVVMCCPHCDREYLMRMPANISYADIDCSCGKTFAYMSPKRVIQVVNK